MTLRGRPRCACTHGRGDHDNRPISSMWRRRQPRGRRWESSISFAGPAFMANPDGPGWCRVAAQLHGRGCVGRCPEPPRVQGLPDGTGCVIQGGPTRSRASAASESPRLINVLRAELRPLPPEPKSSQPPEFIGNFPRRSRTMRLHCALGAQTGAQDGARAGARPCTRAAFRTRPSPRDGASP